MYDLPPVTRAILIANVLAFLLEQVPSIKPLMIAWGALWPLGPSHLVGYSASGAQLVAGFEPWQLVSYAFLHGGWMHITFNMFALWMFGGPIEHLLGARHYAFFYFFCAVTAAIAHLLVARYFTHGFYPTIGASGAVFGLLVAFGLLYPRMKMFLIFFPVPMPAWVFVIGYILMELYLGVTGSQEGVAHFAHLGGAVGGFLLLQYWRGKLPIRPKRILTR